MFWVHNPKKGTDDVVICFESSEDVDVAEIKKRISINFDLSAQIHKVDPGWIVKTSSGKINRDKCRNKLIINQ